MAGKPATAWNFRRKAPGSRHKKAAGLRFLALFALISLSVFQGAALLLLSGGQLWSHRLHTLVSLPALDRDMNFQPRDEAEFSWREGEEYFREHPLLVLGIPLALEQNPGTAFRRIHGREFYYQGQMYDIVRIQKTPDTTWYTVYADHRETALLAALNKAANIEAGKQARDSALPASPNSLWQRLPGPAIGTAELRLFEPPWQRYTELSASFIYSNAERAPEYLPPEA